MVKQRGQTWRPQLASKTLVQTIVLWPIAEGSIIIELAFWQRFRAVAQPLRRSLQLKSAIARPII